MFPSRNPLEGITETDLAPLAHVRRTSFIEKIQDTYWVLAGQSIEIYSANFFWEHPNNHFGFIDYFSLFIPYLFGKLFDKARRNWQVSIGWKLAVIAAGFIYAPFFIIKHGISTVLTLISLPIVGFVHWLYAEDGEKLKRQALELSCETESLQSHLDKSHGAVEDILESSFANNSLQLMQHPHDHSSWRNTERVHCRFEFGFLPIPRLAATDYINIPKFDVRLPIIEYKGINIVSELPWPREEDTLYILKIQEIQAKGESPKGIAIFPSPDSDFDNCKVIEGQQYESIAAGLKEIIGTFETVDEIRLKQGVEDGWNRGFLHISQENKHRWGMQFFNQGVGDSSFYFIPHDSIGKILSLFGYTPVKSNYGFDGLVIDDKANLKPFRSIFELNMGNAVNQLAKTAEGKSFVEAVMSSPSLQIGR